MKQDLATLVEHFPLFRVYIAKEGINMCKEAIKEAPEQIALLEAELSACCDEEEEQQIISELVGIEFHVDMCRGHLNELNRLMKNYIHLLN